jgi:hypothetical protein
MHARRQTEGEEQGKWQSEQTCVHQCRIRPEWTGEVPLN